MRRHGRCARSVVYRSGQAGGEGKQAHLSAAHRPVVEERWVCSHPPAYRAANACVAHAIDINDVPAHGHCHTHPLGQVTRGKHEMHAVSPHHTR